MRRKLLLILIVAQASSSGSPHPTTVRALPE